MDAKVVVRIRPSCSTGRPLRGACNGLRQRTTASHRTPTAAWTGAALLLAALTFSPALAEAPLERVSPQEQQQRDSERVSILRDELAREQRRANAAAQARAQRLAAGDTVGAEEAQRTHQRAADSIAALTRELTVAARHTGRPPRATAVVANKPSAHAPHWWDVYATTSQRQRSAAPQLSPARPADTAANPH